MFRKLLLLICIAYVVVCYGYPCLILPFGGYEYTTEVMGVSITTTYSFGLDGKVTYKSGEVEEEISYKLKGNKIYFSEDSEFDFENDDYVQISSISRIGNLRNKLAEYISIGVGALAVILVLTAPNRKSLKRR